MNDLKKPVRLSNSQIKPAGELLSTSFFNDPLWIHIIPDPSKRKKKLPLMMECMIRWGILIGEVFSVSPDLEGIAIWIPPMAPLIDLLVRYLYLPRNIRNFPLWIETQLWAFYLNLKVGRAPLRRSGHIYGFMSARRTRIVPNAHWHLAAIAVHPDFQGKGYSRILMESMLERIERAGRTCYLEASQEKNVSIWSHYGFKVVGESLIPRTNINITFMIKPPYDNAAASAF